jgi:hypothetical protein
MRAKAGVEGTKEGESKSEHPSGRDSSEAFERARGDPGSASHFSATPGCSAPILLLCSSQAPPLAYASALSVMSSAQYLRPMRCPQHATVVPNSTLSTAPRSLGLYISSALSSTEHRGHAMPLLFEQCSDRTGQEALMSHFHNSKTTAELSLATSHMQATK